MQKEDNVVVKALTHGIEVGDDVLLSMTDDYMFQSNPNIMCSAVDRLWDKFKARGFKRITVRKAA